MKTGLKRTGNEKYYTSHDVVKKLLKSYNKHVPNASGELWIEPSAGNGSFTTYLHERNLVAYDIEPEGDGILEQDFLKLNLPLCYHLPLHFIGNPPFGRQSCIAIQFIKHITSCDKTKSLAFILPKSFKKDSMKRHFPLCFHLVHEEDVDKDGFEMEGTKIDVPCVFQIWKRKDYEREKPMKLEPKGYKFIKNKLHAMFAIRRVGVYAGKMIDLLQDGMNWDKISDQSHYYIQLDNTISFKERDELKERYYEIADFEHNNTVGPKSISKQEFIKVFNKLF